MEQLVCLDYCHQKQIMAYIDHLKEVQELLHGTGLYFRYGHDFSLWVHKQKESHIGVNIDDDLVPSTLYLYIKDDVVIGTIDIRHTLNDGLLKKGGHIGYSIDPFYRNQGYATCMLKEALKICYQWDIWPVLVTCHEDNKASARVIEKCGGVLENKYEQTLRYWIGEKQ